MVKRTVRQTLSEALVELAKNDPEVAAAGRALDNALAPCTCSARLVNHRTGRIIHPYIDCPHRRSA